jgi:hypothetical protein
MSKLSLIANTTPSIFLLNAVSKQFPDKDLREALNLLEGSEVDVKLTVNGVEIPFESTINDLWKQCQDDVNGRALEMAQKIISGAGLDDLFKTIREAEWQVGAALEKAMEKLNHE